MSMTLLVLVARARTTADKNIEAVKKMILEYRRITITEVADVAGISFSLC